MSSSARVAGEPHAHRVARRLESRGLPGLAEALVRLRGTVVGGRWRIESLYAVGAEGAVYLVSDLQNDGAAECVAKIALLPYHRPAEISSRSLRHRRESLRTEAAHLAASASPYMPAIVGLHEFANPLLDWARGGPFAQAEPALVMERLPGLDMDRWLARVHRSSIPRPLLRKHLDRVVVVLLDALIDLEERGFLYADLRPGNLRMIGGPQRHVRLLDAGSLVRSDDRSGRFPHVPHYLPPALFEQHHALGKDIAPSPETLAVMAGRTLYEVVTGVIPVPGEPLDRQAYRDCAVSPQVADVVDGLATGSFPNVLHAMRYLTRQTERAARPRPKPVVVPPDAPRAAPSRRAAPHAATGTPEASRAPAPPVPPTVAGHVVGWALRFCRRIFRLAPN